MTYTIAVLFSYYNQEFSYRWDWCNYWCE